MSDIKHDDESTLAVAPEGDETPSQQHTPKERHSLTLDQRRALRRWAHGQTSRPSHKACIDWFYGQYGQNISQSTISHSLSPKYQRLDSDSQFSGSRLRFGNWPDVEKLVLLWHGQVVASGRNPSNEELAEKAKSIFSQLPRYKDETPPEFSPGWIHRFKKRYGLLIRRQRRHGTAPNPAEDIPYLADAVPRFMTIGADTSPAAIRDSVLRVVGVEATLVTCARVRDEVLRRLENPNPTIPIHPSLAGAPDQSPSAHHSASAALAQPPGDVDGYAEEDPEMVLQNALRQLQQEEAEAEAEAAQAREERTRAEQGLPPLPPNPAAAAAASAVAATHHGLATPSARPSVARFTPTAGPGEDGNKNQMTPGGAQGGGVGVNALNLTPITTSGPPSSGTDQPLRCPFCVNQRMLRTIKEAVEHMSTHVVV